MSNGSDQPTGGAGGPAAKRIGVAVLAALVVLTLGVGVGWMVGRHRTSSTSEATVTTTAPSSNALPKSGFVLGKITGVTLSTITVVNSKGVSHRVDAPKTALVGTASRATRRDIKVGSRIVYIGPGKGVRRAREVLVVPGSLGKMGLLVLSVHGTSIQVKSATNTFTVDVGSAKVNRAFVTTRAALTLGARVIMAARSTPAGVVTAVEIVVLPAHTAFA